MPSRSATRYVRLLRTTPWLADDFDATYRRHQQRTRERVQKRRQSGGSPAAQARLAKLAPDLRAAIELKIARARERRAGSHERLLAGFRWPGDYLNGRRLAPFVERRLRSPLHPMLRLFVAGTSRVQTGLRAGRSKERLFAFGSKLVLLDEPHVSFNAVMRSIIRIDIDETFASWDALRDAIEAAGVPPPNLAVAHVEHDGRVIHPHAYWLLAQAVCFSGRGRPAPQRLFRATERALVEALRALGADPGGLSNTLTGKNPLSPPWSCQVMSATPFNLTNGEGAQPGLVALADHVPPVFEKPRAPAAPHELDVATLLGQSNGLFEVLKRFTFAAVAKFHPKGGGQGDFEDFARATVAYALRLPASRLSEAALEKRARRQAEFVWDRFALKSPRPGRGRCQAACTGKPLREKQQIGARAVAEAKLQQSLDRLVAAYWDLVNRGEVAAGAMPINRDLAAEAGLTVRTVQNHRPALTAAIRAGGERRCKDKKETASSSENPSH